MQLDILTIFPGMFSGPFAESIVRRAVDAGLVTINLHDIRSFATDKHRSVDDVPYGGGAGMVMKPEPLVASIEAVTQGTTRQARGACGGSLRILLSPRGVLLTQELAAELALANHLILVCGRYEGVDERVCRGWIDREISIGDYVLSGGEAAAMVLVDAIVRLIPGVLGNAQSLVSESHAEGLLEYPQYTRPADFRGMKVPDVLQSGNHKAISRWRREHALALTWQRRPDLIAAADLTPEDRQYLASLGKVDSNT